MNTLNPWGFLVLVEILYVTFSTLVSVRLQGSPMEAELARTLARTLVLAIYVVFYFKHFRNQNFAGRQSLLGTILLSLAILLLFACPFFFQKSDFTGALQVLWFLASFVVGFREELFYRGFVQSTLSKKHSVARAIVATSLLFTVYHVSYLLWADWVAIAEVFLFSLSIGLVFYTTRSILVVGLVHGVYDAIPFITPYFWGTLPPAAELIFLVLALVVCLGVSRGSLAQR